MQPIEVAIPAFSTWKMINETVPDLLKDCSEIGLKRLANIIQSKKYSNVFIYERDPTLSYDSYEDIITKYKSFTTWLLGQLVYMISCDKVSRIHELIVDTQLTILDNLSKTHLHVYNELADEYSKTLDLLVQTYRSEEGRDLEIFIPLVPGELSTKLNLSPKLIKIDNKTMALNIIEKLFKVFAYILKQNFEFFSFDSSTYRNLDNLAYLLSEDSSDIRVKIFQLYIDILEKSRSYHDDHNYTILNKINIFSSYFEQTVYEIFNNQNVEQISNFEHILITYFQLCSSCNSVLISNKSRLCSYIYMKSLNDFRSVPPEVVKSCVLAMKTPPFDTSNLEKVKEIVKLIVEQLNFNAFSLFKNLIAKNLLEILTKKRNPSFLNLYEECPFISNLQELLLRKIVFVTCRSNSCQIEKFFKFFIHVTNTLLEVKLLCLKKVNRCALMFFDEKRLFLPLINMIIQHFKNCSDKLDQKLYLRTLVNFSFVTSSVNLDIIVAIILYPHLKLATFHNDNQFPENFIGVADINEHKKCIKMLYAMLNKEDLDKSVALEFLNQFLVILSSGLVSNLNESQVVDIQRIYLNILNYLVQKNPQLVPLALEQLPIILSWFPNVDQVFSSVLPLLEHSEKVVKESAIKTLPGIICQSLSDYIKVLHWNAPEDRLVIRFHCRTCHIGDRNIQDFLEEHYQGIVEAVNFTRSRLDFNSNIPTVFKHILRHISTGPAELKIASLDTLPQLCQHVIMFHTSSSAKFWTETCGDTNREVRKKFTNIVFKTLKCAQDLRTLSEDIKKENFETLFAAVLRFTKKSLQFSDLDYQDTLLETIGEIARVKTEFVQQNCLKVLMYFIIVPTSKMSLIAMNKCFQLAKYHNETTKDMFVKYKRELCDIIAHLCCINQGLVNYNLSTSLGKVSVLFGFCGPKDFVSQCSSHLLPFLVAKVVTMPKVTKLIEEFSRLIDIETAELLASKYGNIFLHVFLHDKDNFDEISNYLERTTGLTGPSLRKRNFRVILNELLLNFYEKRERVLLALRLLSMEDTERTGNDIPDYLQSLFLGVLQYFDVKLLSKKDTVLLSLAELFKFMGPKHITPLKFKIIAMLQSGKYGSSPKLNCEVWSAFIHSCDVESLAPQLATIFVSILPYLDSCSESVNNIFRYLVVENERHTNEFIPDLFFVNNHNVDKNVLKKIKSHLKSLDELSLKEKIKLFLKYLKHETNEVRIRAMEHLKVFMEQNREELDQMILGYNGIDQVMVDLIDLLTLACREKDVALKLACGNVIAELGAVEPTHLPRRYARDSKSFNFFLHEDSFIRNTLNELIKALQTEKNTHSMDRFALAIQEILKVFEVSPDVNSSRNHVWKQFSESQQELMLPLLSSRYMMAQIENRDYNYPIYGSHVGMSFESWLHNWTYSMILNLTDEKKNLLLACMPSMKQDHRILIHFLPHILLHALLEGTVRFTENCIVEVQAVTNAFKNVQKLNENILNRRTLPLPGAEVVHQVITPEEVKQQQATKVVFLLLDFIDRWLREWDWLKGQSGSNDKSYLCLKNFQKKFCKLHLARCNYHSGEYPRALMYLEDYITTNPEQKDNHLSFLAEIYAQLDEPDGVAGVTALRQKEPSVEERILALEVSGKLADVAACYERMTPPLKLHHLQGLIQCYLDLDNVNTALNFAQGAIDLQPEFGNMLLEMQAEPMWRLGRYDELENFLKKPDLLANNSWGVKVGKALLHLKNESRDDFKKVLDEIKLQQVESLGATGNELGLYQRGYSYISKLHAIAELEQIEKCVNELMIKPNDRHFAESVVKKLSMEWELRIKVVQESIRIIEPLLCLRRVALNIGKSLVEEQAHVAVPFFNALLGETWLLSAKIARSAGVHQQAYTYTLKAEEYAPPRLFLEKAKLHWLREEHEDALTTLKRGLELLTPEGSITQSNLSVEQRKIYAKAMLLQATYNDSISNVDTEINVQYYRQSYDAYKEWEKNLVCLAQYYDRIFQSHSDEERDTKCATIQLHMINYFLKSLQYGTEYIYQSMPRILSIWFDFGTRLLDVTSANVREERKNMLFKMTKLIDDALKKLPAFIFLTAFSQITSRICHPQKEVHQELKAIIIKLLQQYPQQCLWMIISVVKSSYSMRSKRCMEILSDPGLRTNTMSKLVKDFTSLAEKLIELCNKEIAPDVHSTTVSQLLRALPRMLTKGDFSEIMIPTQKFRKLVLPNPDFKSSQHNPFPNIYVHIAGIEDEVQIMPSLQRPRRITFRGSDGRGYIYMLKPKDDLRKDFRLMEFNDIVNQLLSRDPESRQRRLNIRLYSVAPLNEECGLIEWVNNLVGLRPILINLYKQKGKLVRNKELNDLKCNLKDSLQKKRDVFLNVLLPKHPPVLGEWFRKTFPDAHNWFTARTAYIRTTAVMSIAGYILGLGDRHGENILLDSTCGDVVHVDFNCLFNKGESFEWPERVPFRLTQNMVSAMGPLGVEGVFRKSCACTLRVLRNNSHTLMSIVTPFVYDPLVSWPRNAGVNANATAERTNEQAVEHVKNIELRLQGVIKTKNRSFSIPLSVDGQTNNLINEAMSVDNLCQMYIGWGPYM